MSHHIAQLLVAAGAEEILVFKTFVEPSEQSLVVDALHFEEVELELLSVATQLGSESIALGLKLSLGQFEALEVVKFIFESGNFSVHVLMLSDLVVQINFVSWDNTVSLVALSFSLAAVTLELVGHVDHVIVFIALFSDALPFRVALGLLAANFGCDAALVGAFSVTHFFTLEIEIIQIVCDAD